MEYETPRIIDYGSIAPQTSNPFGDHLENPADWPSDPVIDDPSGDRS